MSHVITLSPEKENSIVLHNWTFLPIYATDTPADTKQSSCDLIVLMMPKLSPSKIMLANPASKAKVNALSPP